MKNNAEKRKNKDNGGRRKRLFFTGFTMGIADLVPGVSGGTIAFVLGIYDELIYSIRLLSGQFPRLLLRGQVKQAFNLIPYTFLIPLSIGLITAVFGFVQVVTYLLENQSVYVWSVFFGLVLASVYVVSKRISHWSSRRVLLLTTGLVITYVILGFPALNAQPTALVLVSTGAIASLAMILPGISGSLIMVILGQYENVISAVARRDIPQIIFFAIGAIVGLSFFARFLGWLLKNYHAATIAFLMGIMLGSLRRVWPWQIEQSNGIYVNSFPVLDWSVTIAVGLMVIGFVVVWKLEKIGAAQEHDDIAAPSFSPYEQERQN
jgi:putative membrane protein